MKKGQFSGAYWLRYANFTGTSGSGSGTSSVAHTLSVVSANTTMGKATFTRLFSSNDQNHSQTEEPVRGSSDIKTYPSGSRFRAQATAFAGYKFVGWKTNIDGVGNTSVNPIEFTLVKNTRPSSSRPTAAATAATAATRRTPSTSAGTARWAT